MGKTLSLYYTNLNNAITQSLRVTIGSVAIRPEGSFRAKRGLSGCYAIIMRSLRHFVPRDDCRRLRSLFRAKRGIQTPRNDNSLNAFVLIQ